jgi:hypothetical protein
MTRGTPLVFLLLLALMALAWACSHLAVTLVATVAVRLILAGVAVSGAWWVSRQIREMD